MSQDVLTVTTTPPLSGLALVGRINAIVAALVTQSSGAAAPSVTFPFQFWLDTTNNLLKIRNAANSAWVVAAGFSGADWVPYHKGSAIPDVGATGGALLSTASAIAALNTLAANGVDIPSAGTLNLDAATGDAVDVTGTTAITAITLAPGRTRTVRFTGSLTLTHGASLVLPGAANLVTQAGDIAVFRGFAGGVVRCISYQLAGLAPGTALRIGMIVDWPAPNLPAKFLWADGSNRSRTTYAALFAEYGTTHGAGDGSTTFGTPDRRGRVAVGRDDMGGTPANRVTAAVSGIDGLTLGAAGGAQAFTPSLAKMVLHGHQFRVGLTDFNTSGGFMRGTTSQINHAPYTGTPTGADGTQIGGAGGGADQETMPPSMVTNFIIYAGV